MRNNKIWSVFQIDPEGNEKLVQDKLSEAEASSLVQISVYLASKFGKIGYTYYADNK